MSLKKRLAAVLVVAIAAGLTFGIAKSGREITEKQEEIIFSPEKETIYLWYTDEILTSFLSSVAVSYNETHDVRVVPVLESGPEYLEKINQATVSLYYWKRLPGKGVSGRACRGSGAVRHGGYEGRVYWNRSSGSHL